MTIGKHNHKEPSIVTLEMHKQQSKIERGRSKNELTQDDAEEKKIKQKKRIDMQEGSVDGD